MLFVTLSVLTVGLVLLDLVVGAVRIPLGDVWAALTGGDCPQAPAKIVLNIRLIKAVVALLAGAALSVSGLQMQTLFRNPLAGPYVLGISSGASLGVALVVLAGVGSTIGIATAAWAGAATVLLVIAAVGHRIKDIMVILILGMMFSSGVGAVVQILQYLSKEEALKAFVVWTMGSLASVSMEAYASRTMDKMSDGECQRIMIARALAQSTAIILLDEPTSFLDLPNRYELCSLLARLAHDEGKCILFSTHELDIALSLADSIALIDPPQLHCLPTAEMARSGHIERLFSNDGVRFDPVNGIVKANT